MDPRSEMYKNRYKNFILVTTVPVFAFYVAFMIVPIGMSLFYSLFDWAGFTADMDFVGLSNYSSLLFKDEIFRTTIINSLKYVIYGGVLIFAITLLFTYRISNFKSKRLKDFIQMLLFVPNTISPVALGIGWTFLLNPRWGAVNNIIDALGLGAIKRPWLSEEFIFASMMSLLVWIHVGFFLVMFLAAADRIPPSLYESAQLDGASTWKMFTTITVPLVRDIISTSVVMWIIFSFKIFGYIFAFIGGAASDPPVNIRNIAVQLYLTGFGKRTPLYRLGYASGMGIILLLLVVLLTYIAQRLFRTTETLEF
ncbi:MAG TPA: sugar ABC transporter permease [Limnochordia bacterium]|nr:sugar ABC transporter permease [Limnochordia bacterium]